MAKEPQATDVKLVSRVSRRDQDALASLYDRHRSLVFTLALRILRDRFEAEEILSEVFFQAWRSAGGYDPARGSVEGWLINLCRSRAIDRLRARGRRGAKLAALALSEPPGVAGAADGPESRAESQERREQVMHLLSLLSPEQRRAIEMAYYEGYSHSEIAEALGEPLGTVKTRIRQGLIALRANFSATFV